MIVGSKVLILCFDDDFLFRALQVSLAAQMPPIQAPEALLFQAPRPRVSLISSADWNKLSRVALRVLYKAFFSSLPLKYRFSSFSTGISLKLRICYSHRFHCCIVTVLEN